MVTSEWGLALYLSTVMWKKLHYRFLPSLTKCPQPLLLSRHDGLYSLKLWAQISSFPLKFSERCFVTVMNKVTNKPPKEERKETLPAVLNQGKSLTWHPMSKKSSTSVSITVHGSCVWTLGPILVLSQKNHLSPLRASLSSVSRITHIHTHSSPYMCTRDGESENTEVLFTLGYATPMQSISLPAKPVSIIHRLVISNCYRPLSCAEVPTLPCPHSTSGPLLPPIYPHMTVLNNWCQHLAEQLVSRKSPILP